MRERRKEVWRVREKEHKSERNDKKKVEGDMRRVLDVKVGGISGKGCNIHNNPPDTRARDSVQV